MSLHAEVADYSCSGQMLKNCPAPELIMNQKLSLHPESQYHGNGFMVSDRH